MDQIRLECRVTSWPNLQHAAIDKLVTINKYGKLRCFPNGINDFTFRRWESFNYRSALECRLEEFDTFVNPCLRDGDARCSRDALIFWF
jgi:hypothetical protein